MQTQTQASLVPTFVYPISDAPLSVDIMAERVETPESGEPITSRETAVAYRDGAGRMRIDLTIPGEKLSKTGDVVQIFDIARGFTAILVPTVRRAFRGTVPTYTPEASLRGVNILGGPGIALSGEPGKRRVETKALGKRTIEGIEFEGELTTVIVEGERTLVATDESWFSKELGLFGLKIATSPGRKTTSRIQKVSRKEPDPSLFVIPPDYVIEEFPETAPTGRLP